MENLGLMFVGATEMAAISARMAAGSGNKNLADKKATEAMRNYLKMLPVKIRVVIGEGERDKAPMLYIGEELGTDKFGAFDIAVDPLENTNATARLTENAICVMGVSEKGGLFSAPDIYMQKLVAGKECVGKVSLDLSIKENIKSIAICKGKSIKDVTVVILKRERHEKMIEEIRTIGANIRLIDDGDVLGGLSALVPGTGVDCLMGIGAAPEGVITAVATRCLGGVMNGKLMEKVELEDSKSHEQIGQLEQIKKYGIENFDKVYTEEDLAPGKELYFVATGVTDGNVVHGVKTPKGGAVTETIFLDKNSQTISFVSTTHILDENFQPAFMR